MCAWLEARCCARAGGSDARKRGTLAGGKGGQELFPRPSLIRRYVAASRVVMVSEMASVRAGRVGLRAKKGAARVSFLIESCLYAYAIR